MTRTRPPTPTATSLPHTTALIVVDAQRGFDETTYWGPRNNPDADPNIAALITAFAAAREPIVYVRHASADPHSPVHRDHPGHAFKDYLEQVSPSLIVTKSVNSSFHGTPDLHAWLQRERVTGLVVCGITTNHCCETTARVAGNLGYDTIFAFDATHTFDRVGPDGRTLTADALTHATCTNLHGEFATVMTTAAIVARCRSVAAYRRAPASRDTVTPYDEGLAAVRDSVWMSVESPTGARIALQHARPPATISVVADDSDVEVARDKGPLSQWEAARIWAASTARRDDKPEPAPVESALPIIERGLRAPGSTLHLALRGSDAVGFAVVVPSEDGLEILYLGVDPNAWGAGVAGHLLCDVTDHAVETARKAVDLWVYDDNTRAVEVYRRHGWLETDEVRIHATSGRREQRFVRNVAEHVDELEHG
ncbi:isochorismatase family protein [Nocardioides cavernae]|uniref:isochorismatase family protein n=1 Tax=Nocardioides TaxID=1839 RepID=UPI0009E8155C|nr:MULTISPECIES: isochorismatase family protein [Nocardioides]MCK9824455.1 isochorismatase family protein [Nocardioides cavernae]